MPISIEADPTLAQGYLKVNGVTAATVTSTGLTTASLQNAAVTPAKLSQPYTLATAQASTSGTAIDFTGIPSWARRITVMLNGVSTSGSSIVQIQLGDSGGIETSGYTSAGTNITSAVTAGASSTTGLVIGGNSDPAHSRSGIATIGNISGNSWTFAYAGTAFGGESVVAGGTKTLSDTLTRIRITTVNGTDTFDAGSINIAYEG